MDYIDYLTYSEFIQKIIDNKNNLEFFVKYDSTLSINYGVDGNGFFTAPNNTTRPIDNRSKKYKSSDWNYLKYFQNNCAVFAHELYKSMDIKHNNKLNILYDKIPNFIPYNSFTNCSIIDFSLEPLYANDIHSQIGSIDVWQKVIRDNMLVDSIETIEYQIIPPIKIDIKISDYILNKFNKNNWNDVARELKRTCIDQSSQIRTNIIDPAYGYLHDGIIIKSNTDYIIVQNDYQYNLLLSRDCEPINKLNSIELDFERNRLTQEKAIEMIDDINDNFKQYYPNIPTAIYPKIKQHLEYTKIKIKQR